MSRFKKVASIIYPRLIIVTFIFQLLSFAAFANFVVVRRFVYPYVPGGDYSADKAFVYGIVAGLIFLFSVPLSILQLSLYTYFRVISDTIVHSVFGKVVCIFSLLIVTGYVLANITNLVYELFLSLTRGG